MSWRKLLRVPWSRGLTLGTRIKGSSTKQFADELDKLNQRLLSRENFALVRFGDGEMIIIDGKAIDLSEKYNGEHQYLPGNPAHEEQRSRLRDSLTFQHPHYFVGIACPCCVGEDNFFNLKKRSAQAEDQLTWANLFVNSNYAVFRDHTVAALVTRTVNMVCHEKADTDGLPFAVQHTFTVGGNSWVNDYARLRDELVSHIEKNQVHDEVFLFSAGVLSNILVHELFALHPNNTYIDLGSVFDVDLGLGKTRKYLKKGKTLKKTCVWM